MASTLVLQLVLDHLDSNEMAVDGRLICKAAQHHLCLPEQCTAQLSLPLPSSAGDAAWQPHVQQAFRQLSYIAKVQALSTAASSGGERNLELAWSLLRPCLFPGLLQLPVGVPQYYVRQFYVRVWNNTLGHFLDDPGEAAITAGHAHLLPWLVRNGCPISTESVLVAAAEHLDLEGMQRAMQLLGVDPNHPGLDLRHCMVAAAARSGVAAISKLVLLLSARRGSLQQQQLLLHAATHAARGGRLPALQCLHGLWLHNERLMCDQQGLAYRQGVVLFQWSSVLWAALRHAHLHVADWLMAQEGFSLERFGPAGLWMDAGRSGSTEPVRWLLRHGVCVHSVAIRTAAEAGNLEGVQLLYERLQRRELLTADVFHNAASSGSVPTATWLLQAGCPMSPEAYARAAKKGNAAMVLWLAHEAGCPWDACTLAVVIRAWPARSKSSAALLPAVRALLEAGCPHGVGKGDHSSTCNAAARGDLPLLRYLHEEVGLGFGQGTMAAAARGGCEAVLEWLVGAGCEPGTEYPYVRAAAHGDLATLSCLHRLGVPFWDASWWREAKEVKLPLVAVRWMVERGAPWDEEGAKAIVEASMDNTHRDEESLAWLQERIA